MTIAEMEIQARADRDEIRRLKAKLAEAERNAEAERSAKWARLDKAEAEVERLTATAAHLSARASEYEADRDRNAALCMDARAKVDQLQDLILWCESDDSEEGHAWDALVDEAHKLRAALRGGGE